MTTTTNTSVRGDSASPPEAPATPTAHSRFGARRGSLICAALLTTTVAAVALVVSLTGHDDDTTPAADAHTGLIENGSIRAHEGSVGDAVDRPDNRLDPRLAKQAERLERQAHLDGQAKTYGRDRSSITNEGYPENYYPHGHDYDVKERGVNPNGPGALASEHNVDGAGD